MRKTMWSVVAVSLLAASSQANDVYLSWTDFEPNIDFAWAAGGYTGAGDGLTASDYLFFKHSVKAKLETIYAGYTTTFLETLPGGVHEKILFGASTASTSLLGLAERIDWRNDFKDDIADVYAKNFGLVVDAGAHTRPENLERLSTALAGTAAHELGHNLGLQHYDCYCHSSRMAPVYGAPPGVQNDYIMATGSTGLTADGRTVMRSFNLLESIKLEYADDVSPSLGKTVTELGGANGTIGTAQFVFGEVLSLTGVSAVNVVGSTSSGGDVDLYKFEATAGAKLSFNTFSAFQPGTPTDTLIELADAGGTAIFSNHDISYAGDLFMTGVGPYSSDSLIWQWTAGYTGTYYIGITSPGAGDYELLITGLSAVPEPASLFALAAGVALLARRRKRPTA